MIALSAAVFLWAAAITSFWIPNAFRYSLFGLVSGGILGLLGLTLTRWEATPQAIYYTPNRWLILCDHPRCDGSIDLRPLANLARLVHERSRLIVAGCRRSSRFDGRGSHRNWLLLHLLSRRSVES